MITIALALSGALLAPAANSGGAITHGTFDQSDVVRIGRSLESVAPKHPDYTYPVRFRVVDKDEINAVSYFFFEEDEDELHPAIDIYQGLIDKVVGDNEGILAAVIAHELGHIALGHSVSGVMTDPELTDADNIYQREQELEADIAGASYLERSGRSKEAMIDLIKEFDRLDREVGWGWFETLASDHPSAIARAAAVDDDPRVWNAILSFDTGLAFLESRRWALAGRAFQEAIVKEPRLLGAVVNDAYASLMIYWDLLPLGVRAKWFRPDFGAFLTDPLAAARGDEVTDEDRRRYAAAMQKLERAIEKAPDVKRAKELLALAKILEPDGKESVIRAGLTELESLLTSEESRYRKVAIVNNLLVGYHRIEDLNKGFNLLIDTINATIVDDKIVFNSAAVENLVYITWQNASEETERTVLALFGHWLKNTSDASSAWDAARERYEELCEKLDVEPKETEPALLFFCRPVSIFIEGKQ
ncbi:MAG: M48 family metalloprotease, partial [Armatimonadetes bacterium]|nr:M48 family metalloprotease [Armatimonadota bacterium]